MRSDSGFTLTELVIVIGLIGIIAAIAIPNIFGWLPKYRLRGAVQQIKHVIQVTKSRAIRENANAVMQFNLRENSYEAFVDNGGGDLKNAGNGKRNEGEKVFRRGKMPVGIDIYRAGFSGRASRIQFNGQGFPGSFIGHVYLKNDNNDYMGVKVGIAGNARITISNNRGRTWN